jgi:hypothetical protein
MDAPTSAILAQVCTQCMGHKQLYPVITKHQTIGYLRYVDDSFIIFSERRTNIGETIAELKK